MEDGDLSAVLRIAAQVHPGYPEGPEVFAERLALFPAGCLILAAADGVPCGYAVAHPACIGCPPALDSLLGQLPAAADCLYLHDAALLPPARGAGAVKVLLAHLRQIAQSAGLDGIALVAVNGSAPLWRGQGFVQRQPASVELAAKLASYGADAEYLFLGGV